MIETWSAPIFEAVYDPDELAEGDRPACRAPSAGQGAADPRRVWSRRRRATSWSRGIDPSRYGEKPPLCTFPAAPALHITLAAPVGFRFDPRQFIGDDGHDRRRVAQSSSIRSACST